MRKIIIVSIIISIIVGAGLFTWLYFFIEEPNSHDSHEILELSIEENLIEDECTDEYFEEEEVSVNTSEKKVSPNATFLIKKYYKECGHTTKEYAEIPMNIVNMTEEEVINEYKDWEVQEFHEMQVVIYKELEGICNEHFIIKEEDGFIVIYIIGKEDKETLYEITEISTEYLTEKDLERIRQGIRANGKEELNSIIEDFE